MLRAFLHRFVPVHFRDPFGLAMRLLRSGSQEARFAMALVALGAAALPLDLLLEPFETRRERAADPPKLPIVLVAGAPRSGTTLLTLALIRALPVSYLNNLIEIFPRSPITANVLFGAPFRHSKVTLSSYYGRTRGFRSPTDGLALWDRWLGRNRTLVPDHLSPEAGAEMIRFFGAYEEAFGGPLVAKNNGLDGCAHLVGEWLPNARFLGLRREPLWLAQSLLQARRDILGDDALPYGIDDPDRATDPDPIRDVVRQVRFHEILAEKQQAALGARWEPVVYEDFCRDPVSVVMHVARDLLHVAADPDAVRRALPPLHVSRRRLLPEAEFARLEREIADAFPTPA